MDMMPVAAITVAPPNSRAKKLTATVSIASGVTPRCVLRPCRVREGT